MYGLHTIDIVVIILYFTAMVVIGFWSMRRIRNQKDFFLGGRRFGKLIQIFANFGQATSSDTGPAVATTTYHNGAAGVWSALLMLFATPFFWFTALWYRRMRTVTLGDYYAQRYNSKTLGAAYACMSSVGLCVLLSISFVVLDKTVRAMTPKAIDDFTVQEQVEYQDALRKDDLAARNYATLTIAEQEELDRLEAQDPHKHFSYVNRYVIIISIVIIVCLYAIAGGLEAAFVSDMIQGVFILLLSVILIPFAIIATNNQYGQSGILGAFRSLHQQKSASFFEIFGSPHNIDFTWYYILTLSILALINVSAQANTFVAPSSARDEYTARFGMTFGIQLKRLTTVLWGVTAMFAVLLFADKITDPDLLWGYASKQLLGPLNIGLIGLMIAALMAALMSTADMMMITASGLMTHNLYRVFRPHKSEKHYVVVGRCLGGVVVLGAALISLMSESVLGVLKLWWEFGVIFATTMLMGVLWKKTNCKAAWAQITVSLVFFFLLPMFLPIAWPSLRTDDYLTQRTKACVIERVYQNATPEDVASRQDDIRQYQQLPATEKLAIEAPPAIELGQAWSKVYRLPRKAIFWTQGVELVKEHDTEFYRGQGMLNIFLVLLDKAGVPLKNNSYALNETIRLLVRIFLPFIVLFVVSSLTRRSQTEEDITNRVAAKMLTPVAPSEKADQEQVRLSYENPQRMDHCKLLGPNSNWLFRKWNREDAIGFVVNTIVILAIIGILYFLVNLGA